MTHRRSEVVNKVLLSFIQGRLTSYLSTYAVALICSTSSIRVHRLVDVHTAELE